MKIIKNLPTLIIVFILSVLILFSCKNENKKADNLLRKGKELHEQGRCVDALKLYNKALLAENSLPEIRKEKLIKLHIAKGESYKEFSINDTALVEFEQALKISEEINDTLNIAICYKKYGETNRKLKKYKEAIENYNISLQLFEKIDKKDKIIQVLMLQSITKRFVDTTYIECHNIANKAFQFAKQYDDPQLIYDALFNIGDIHFKINQIDSCLIYFNKAIDFAKESKETVLHSYGIFRLGQIYYKQFKDYSKAIQIFKESIEQEKKERNNQILIAKSMSNISTIYDYLKNFDIAITYGKETIKIFNEIGNKKLESDVLGNLINTLVSDRKFESALSYVNDFKELKLSLNDSLGYAMSLYKLGQIYFMLDSLERAINVLNSSKAVYEKWGNEEDLIIISSGIASAYADMGEAELALPNYLKVKAYYENKNGIVKLIAIYHNLGTIYSLLENFSEAKKYFHKSINLIEKIMNRISVKYQIDFYSQLIRNYHRLILAYYMSDDIESTFSTIEYSKAKVLDKKLKNENGQKNSMSIKSIQENISDSIGIVIFSASDYSYLIQMYISKDTVISMNKRKSEFNLSIIPKIKPYLREYIETNGSKNELDKLENYDTSSNKKINMELFLQIVSYYRSLISRPLTDYNLIEIQRQIAKALYQFLISDLDSEISSKSQLLIVPDGMFHLLPFEAFINEKDEYFIETHNISYSQSLSTLEILKNRNYSLPKDIIIFGACSAINNFDTIQINETDAQDIEQARIDLFEGNTVDNIAKIYKQLEIGKMNHLIGSEKEIAQLSSIFEEANHFTYSDVTEHQIKRLSEKSALQKYKIIHISTHSMAVQELPKLSAIVLSQSEDMKNEDGFLTVDEIYKLKINTDFVNLSSCETGSGKIYSSEGVVGLSQAFLIAGANSVSSTLWSVSDKSTECFMSEFYSLLAAENMSYSLALNKVKRDFINEKHDSYWAQPFYWAPFVFYGNYKTSYQKNLNHD
ncbi:MAG: CHAT domain-containing protein [Bacteroidetes bacterium]|nr:CHAT domain-containing protein [Bacteroidota bacterium]MBT7492561.1 CHAT domain-containing protein [Bacteroidota bacterium]